jgi:hypothetical protein
MERNELMHATNTFEYWLTHEARASSGPEEDFIHDSVDQISRGRWKDGEVKSLPNLRSVMQRVGRPCQEAYEAAEHFWFFWLRGFGGLSREHLILHALTADRISAEEVLAAIDPGCMDLSGLKRTLRRLAAKGFVKITDERRDNGRVEFDSFLTRAGFEAIEE